MTYYMVPLHEVSRMGKSRETESGLVVVRGYGREEWRAAPNGYKVYFD